MKKLLPLILFLNVNSVDVKIRLDIKSDMVWVNDKYNKNNDNASSSSMYKSYAHYYDKFYSRKNYTNESEFLNQILTRYNVKTVLDVGCGTGTHISKLEEHGFSCSGIDLNEEMLNFAKNKIKGSIFQADMRTFNLSKIFDSVICMFAVFNHNLNDQDALRTLQQIKQHLKINGILIIDLYNPQTSGEKTEKLNNIARIMKWDLDIENKTCNSIVKFIEEDKVSETTFPLRIYSMTEIKTILEEAGFKNIMFYDNYTNKPGNSCSKNLIVVSEVIKWS